MPIWFFLVHCALTTVNNYKSTTLDLKKNALVNYEIMMNYIYI